MVGQINWCQSTGMCPYLSQPKTSQHPKTVSPHNALPNPRRVNIVIAQPPPCPGLTVALSLQEGLSCTACTLQWYWSSGNSCVYDGDYFDYYRGIGLKNVTCLVVSTHLLVVVGCGVGARKACYTRQNYWKRLQSCRGRSTNPK